MDKKTSSSTAAERAAALEKQIDQSLAVLTRGKLGGQLFIKLLKKAWSEVGEDDPALTPGLVFEPPMRKVLRKHVPDYHLSPVLATPLHDFPPDGGHPFDPKATGRYFMELGFAEHPLSPLSDDVGRLASYLDAEFNPRSSAFILQRVFLLEKDSVGHSWDHDPSTAEPEQTRPYFLLGPAGQLLSGRAFRDGLERDYNLRFATLPEAQEFAGRAISEVDYPILIGLCLRWYSWF